MVGYSSGINLVTANGSESNSPFPGGAPRPLAKVTYTSVVCTYLYNSQIPTGPASTFPLSQLPPRGVYALGY